MKKGRLEAFSDGVVAIIITIMGLELHVPHGDSISAMIPVLPALLSYVLSFVYIGIYWNNHHHMIYVVEKINGAILWANLNLLFWLSLIPVTTAWMSENHSAAAPSALYGADLLLAAIAYFLLEQLIIVSQGRDSLLKRALGRDLKGKLSPALYLSGIAAAFWSPLVSQCIYVLVALLWLVPDQRIERAMSDSEV